MIDRTLLLLTLSLLLTGCGGGGGGGSEAAPVAAAVGAQQDQNDAAGNDNNDNGGNDGPGDDAQDPLDTELIALIEQAGLTGDASFNRTLPAISDPLPQLGMKLFFSKSLGGELDAACVTCHHPTLGGGDALSLPVGVGAQDPDVLGPGRTHAASATPNVPRNAPTVFNIGLWDGGLFWDSRVESFGKEPQANGAVSDIRTPDVAFGLADPDAGANLPTAQARFPVTSADEMRGSLRSGEDNATLREHLAARIGGYGVAATELAVNGWLAEFQSAFGNGSAEELITFDNIATALAEYQRSMVFTQHAFADYIEGDLGALSDAQKRGAILFYTDPDDGGGGCVNCHSGDLLSDELHHTVAFPQFGPGKGDGNADDFGRERETNLNEDRYRFRTPSLLNVTMTAPYGHAGAYETLAEVMQHYNNPAGEVDDFFDDGAACGLAQLADHPDCATLYPASEANSEAALAKLADERDQPDALFPNLNLNNNERADLVAFMQALTDPCVEDRSCLAPWIPDNDPGPDNQQLNARDADGNLL